MRLTSYKLPFKYLLSVVILSITSCTNPFGGKSFIDINAVSLGWSNKNYDFGDQQIGSSSTQTFYISNTGNTDAINCGPVKLSDNVNFSIISQTCTSNTLLQKSQCEVVVESHPQTTGEKNLVLDRVCHVNSSVVSLVNQVKVNAVHPTAHWTPMNYDFGSIAANYNTFSKKFTLTNQGTSAITNCGFVKLSNATDFYIQADTCGLNNINPGDSCDVYVIALPTTSGEKTTTLSRTCEASYTFSTTVDQIKVTGFDSFLSLYPAAHDFGSLYEGTSNNTYLNLYNNSADSAVSCSTATLSDSTYFTLSYDDCGTRGLTQYDGCYLGVQTSASAPIGEHKTNLIKSCTFADSSVKTVTIPIRMETIAATPLLYSFNGSYDYGNTYVGSTGSTSSFTFYNGGYAAASGCGAPILTNTTDFSIVSNSCGSVLPSGNTCTVDVRALPASTGAKTGQLSMTCTNGGVVTSSLQQTGKPYGPDLQFSPDSFNYGTIAVGSSGLDNHFAILNKGPQDATGCSNAVLSNTTDFAIITDTCAASDVAGQSSCTISVRGLPTTTGAKVGTLTRTCTVGGTIVANLSVDGFTPSPNLYWSNTAYNFGDVNIGANSTTANFYLYNNGTATATGCTSPTLSNTTDFSIVYEGCGTNDLSSGGWANCVAQVRANPQSSGTRSTTLSRTCTTGGTVSTVTNGIVANGKLSADWKLEYAILSFYGFGTLSQGNNSANIKYFFRNPNEDSLTGCTLAELDNTNDFEIVTNNCSAGSMSAGTSCMVEVRAIGQTVGSKTATLSRSCSETGQKTTNLSSNVSAATNAVSVARSGSTTCVLMDNGTVRCWGQSRFHSSFTPTEVHGVTNAVKISVADDQACALTSTGQINCWGSNWYSILGPSGGGIVPGVSNVVDVLAAKESSCALINDGASEQGIVKCWGGPYNPSTPTTITYSNGTILTGAVQLAAGGYNGQDICILLNTKEIACFFMDFGQAAKLAGISDAEELSMSNGYLYYRMASGQVKSRAPGYPIAVVPGLTNVVKLAANHSPFGGGACAIVDNGTTEIGVAKCWDAVNPLRTIAGIDHAVSLVFGDSDAHCFVKDDGKVYCKGYSTYYGANGDLEITDAKSMNKIDMGGAVAQATSGHSICAAMQNGQVKCVGLGRWDAGSGLGDGVTGNSKTPVIVSGINDAVEVKSGEGFTCAALASGSVKCWGYNTNGRLGDGTGNSTNTPVTLPNLSNVKSIAVAYQHGCALIDDGASNIGTVKCWGANSGGYVRGGAVTNLNTPVDMGISGAVKIAATGYASCAVMNTGIIKCWGNDYWGQLGNGPSSNAETTTPGDVLGISNAVDISGGDGFFCAQLNNGTMKCWGYNDASQIGSTPDNTTPYLIPGLTGIQQVMASSKRSCALLTTGRIKCFGSDVGDHTTDQTVNPRFVMNVQDAKKMVPGYAGKLCYINTSDELMCYEKFGSDNFKKVSGF